jgi:hypothetical protein
MHKKEKKSCIWRRNHGIVGNRLSIFGGTVGNLRLLISIRDLQHSLDEFINNKKDDNHWLVQY